MQNLFGNRADFFFVIKNCTEFFINLCAVDFEISKSVLIYNNFITHVTHEIYTIETFCETSDVIAFAFSWTNFIDRFNFSRKKRPGGMD